MRSLILYLLYTVSAQQQHAVYSRIFLRGLRKLEIERVQIEYINSGFAYIENAVITTAKQGITQYTTDPVLCERAGLDIVVCEHVIHGILALVSERFPDSEVLYDANTKRYTLKWD